MEAVWRGVGVVAYQNLLKYAHSKTWVVTTFGFPLLYLVIFGVGFSRVAGTLTPGSSYLPFLFPGVISMIVLQTALMMAGTIMFERQLRLLRAFMVAPISRGSMLIGKSLGAAVLGLLQTALLVAIAPLIHVPMTLLAVLKLAPLVVILSVWLSGLVLLCATQVKSIQTFQAVMQFVSFPIIFTAGIFYPLRGIPTWLALVGKLNPASYGVDAIRHVLLASGSYQATAGLTLFGRPVTILDDALIVAGSGAAFMALAIWLFNRQELEA